MSAREATDGTPRNAGYPQAMGVLAVVLLLATWPGAVLGWGVAQFPGRERWRSRLLIGASGAFLLIAVALSKWVSEQALQMAAGTGALVAAYGALLQHGAVDFDAATLVNPLLRLWACGLLTAPIWAAYWLWRPLTARELRTGSTAPLGGWRRHIAPLRANPEAIRLGHYLGGDLTSWRRGAQLWLPTDTITRHLAFLGATGSGKTEGLMRVVFELAKLGWAVHYIDGKGDRELGERFRRVMLRAGLDEHAIRQWPDEPFDFWRGGNADVYNKLYQLAASTEPFYDNVGKAVLGKAVRREPGAPDISNSRLFLAALAAAVDPKDRDQKSVLVKYEGVMQDVGHLFDGSWAFEDARASYIGIDSLRLGEGSRQVAAAFMVEAARSASIRTASDNPTLIVLDEFSAAGGDKALALVERARSKGVGFCFSSQTIEGLGDPATANRLLGNCNVLAVFRTPNPEPLLSLLGTKRSYEIGEQLQGSSPTGLATRRLQHQFKVQPDLVRGMEDGEAILIHRGRFARLFVDRVS